MGRTGKRILAGVAMLAMTALVVPFTVSTAGAVSPLPITCTAAGSLEIVSGPAVTNWKLIGVGSCQGDFDGTYALGNLIVQGTSDSIGLCGDEGVVTNLNLAATGTLLNLSNPLQSKTLAGQRWVAPVTSFPFTSPFVIQGPAGNEIGGGTITSRIFGKCPAVGGTPSMTVQFSFLT